MERLNKLSERELNYARKYRSRNPEKVKEATKKWRERNKEKVAASLKRWKLANKDKVEASRQRFFQLNPEYKNTYQRKWWSTLVGRYLTLKITARNKKRELKITFEQWQDLMERPCYYCKLNLVTNYGYCLDRIDSNLGYTLENVVPCCQLCNQMKSNLTQKEFMNHVKRIYEND